MANTTLTQFPAGQTQYKINFDYLARPFVVVTLVNSNDAAQNRVLTVGNDYGFLNPTTIEIYTSQAGFDILQIHRFTSTELLVEFRDGSVLTATDLTNAELQAIHIAEEGRDQTTGLAKQYADQAVEAGKDAQDILNQIILLGKNGYTPVGSFENGWTVRLQNDVLQYGSGPTTTHWRWEGTLPKVVPPGSTPQGSGGIGKGMWIDVTDATLRGQLATTSGASMVKASDGRTVEEWLVQSDSASYRAKNMAKLALVDYKVHNRQNIGVCFLGDSMTAGFDRTSSDVIPPQDGDWATRASMNYPYRFADYLAEQAGCGVSPFVMRAISGHTAIQAYNEPGWQSNPNCDVVVMMYAINDSEGVAGSTLDIYMEYMEKLIRRYIDWGHAVVVCLPSGGGQGAWNPSWLHWAKRMRMMARIYGCATFDAHQVMLNRHYGAVQSDGTHFNSMGYAIHGEKLASMFMAGGLVETYRPVTNETTYWPGVMHDSIGWCNPEGNANTSRSDGSFTRDKIVGGIPANARCVQTFSFYLDAEAAHVYGKVTGQINTIMTNGRWWNNEAKSYYQHAADMDNSFGASLNRVPKNAYDYSGAPGSRKFIGRVIGRGWHTITMFNALDGTSPDWGYINNLTIQPIPIGLSTEQMWGQDEERRYKVVHCRKHPSPSGQGNNLPQAVSLTNILMKVPQSVLGTGPGQLCVPTQYFYNTVPFILRITNEKGDYIEAHMYKNGSSGLTWASKILKTTYSPEATPTITGSLATAKQNTVVAAGSEGANQPLESIFDFNGGLQVQTGNPTTDIAWTGGVYMLFTLTWPGVPPTGYWNMEVEGSDWFGNSESSFGAY